LKELDSETELLERLSKLLLEDLVSTPDSMETLSTPVSMETLMEIELLVTPETL
jgi:hypothetical protein